MYYKIEKFVTEEGRQIDCRIPYSENDVAGLPAYHGVLGLTFKDQASGHTQQIPLPFEFPKDLTLTECFAKYEEIGAAAFENYKNEMAAKQLEESRKIIVPGTDNLIQFPK